MAGVVSDVLSTRLELAGLGEYVRGFEEAATAIGLLDERLDSTARRQLGLGVAAGAAGIAIAAGLFKAAEAAGEDDAAFQRAANSFRAAGQAFPQAELEAFTAQLERTTGIADDQIAGFVGLLGTFKLTEQQAKTLTPAILDTAEALKAQGVTAEALSVQIGKALESGNTQGLRRVGIIIDPAEVERVGMFSALIDALRKNGEGAAAMFRGTLPGSLQAARTAFGTLEEAIGKPFVGALTLAATIVEHLARGLAEIPGAGALIGTVLAGASAALIFYSGQTLLAARNTILLMEAQLKQAAAAEVQAGANLTAGGAVGGGGLLGKAGGFLRGGGGLALGLAAGGLLAGGALHDAGTGDDAGSFLERLGGRGLQGAGIGAAVGSFIPVVGNVVGAAVGGLVGVLEGEIEELFRSKKAEHEGAKNPELEAAQKTNQILERQLAEIRGLREGNADVLSGPASAREALVPGRRLRYLAEHVGP